MSSQARKIAKKKKRALGPGAGPPGSTHAKVTMRLNPKTGVMQEYHFTKGWKK